MVAERALADNEMLDEIVTPDSQLIPTFDELREINDDPTVDFENSDVPEDDDDRAGVL